jgi:hypothetical protein
MLTRLLLLAVSVGLVACKSKTGPDGGTGEELGSEVSASIGTAGGTLSTEGNRASVWIPANALPRDTQITLTVKDPADYPNGAELLSPVYEFGPDGTVFGREVVLSMLPSRPPPEGEIAVIAVLDTATNSWVPLEGSREVSTGDGNPSRVVGSVEHFSAFTTWHVVNQYPQGCRELLAANALGINQPNTVTVTGATLLYRQQGFNGAVEYGSMWEITSPTVTISGVGVVDGNGRWGAWELGEPTSGRPKPVPTGFPISGKKWSISVPIRALVQANKVALSIDDYCPGNYDIGFNCTGACLTDTPGGTPDAGGGGNTPVQCQVGGLDIASNMTSPRKLAVAGNVLLGANDLGTVDGFQTFDLTNPVAPVRRDGVDLSGSGPRQIAVSGTTAFVTDNTKVAAINIANPADISITSSFDLNADTELKTALGNPPNGVKANGIAIAGDYAYVVASDRGFVVLNVSNPAQMTRVGFATTGSVGSGAVALSGTKAYFVSNENRFCVPGPCDPPNHRGVMVFDITTAATPTKFGQVAINNASPSSLVALGEHLYVTSTNTQFFTVNISNPAAPSVVGTSVETNGFAYDAAIGKGKLLVASNSTEGHLQLYSLANPGAPARLSDERVVMTGGGWGVAASATHAYLASTGRISVVDLDCPAK